MTIIEKATIIHYHRHLLETHSNKIKTLGWTNENSQLSRFEVLSTVGHLNDSDVLDIGCGYGDLKTYLDGRFSNFKYIGIDQMPEFIVEAKQRFKESTNVSFYQADFASVTLPQVDYVMACGVLSYHSTDSEFYKKMIRKIYKAANRALVFNMLDETQFPDHPLLVGHNCEEITKFCRSLTPHVRIERAYGQDDFTVFLYKSNTSNMS